MINTEERTLIVSSFVAVIDLRVVQICTPRFIRPCLLKNETITLCLTDFDLLRIVCTQKKNISRNLMVSQYFRPFVKMGPKPKKLEL